jgi:uncharacterized protein YdgA (DUF945 family)
MNFESKKMKKKIVLAVSFVGVAAAVSASYVGASWYAGKQIEKQLDATVAEITATIPAYKISDVKIRRGIFSTSHEMSIGLDADCFTGGTSGLESAAAKELKNLEKMKVRLVQEYKHGPLTFDNGIKPNLASYTGSLMLDARSDAKFKESLGNRALVSWNGKLAFDGAYDFLISSPTVEHKKDGEHLSWKGISGSGTGNMYDKTYQVKLLAPGLASSRSANGVSGAGEAVIENITMSFSGHQGASRLPLGSGTITVENMRFSGANADGAVSISNLSYSADLKEANNFINVMASYKIGNFIVGGTDTMQFGPMALEVGFEHLHAPTLSTLYKDMNSFMCVKQDDSAKLAQTMKQLKEMANTLLKNDPVFILKQAKLASKHGDVELNGKIALTGFEPGMVDNMQVAMTALPSAIAIDFNATATENLFMTIAKQSATSSARHQLSLRSDEQMSPEKIKAAETMAEENLRSQLQMVVAQNLVKQENDRLSVNFSFAKGKASLNGQPIDLPFLPRGTEGAAPVGTGLGSK